MATSQPPLCNRISGRNFIRGIKIIQKAKEMGIISEHRKVMHEYECEKMEKSNMTLVAIMKIAFLFPITQEHVNSQKLNWKIRICFFKTEFRQTENVGRHNHQTFTDEAASRISVSFYRTVLYIPLFSIRRKIKRLESKS